jgi:hypothetical protein
MTTPQPPELDAAQSPPPLDLPPVPRPVTRRAARRSWAEAPVRVWEILTVIVVAAATYLALTHLTRAMRDRWLILHGTPVEAQVTAMNSSKQSTRPLDRRETIIADLNFRTPGGQELTVKGSLTPAEGNLYVGDRLPIRIDPEDPTRWTDRAAPRPWLAEMTAVLFLLPLLALAVLMMLWARRRTLNLWRRGEPAVAVVVDTKQSSIAPRSRVMRYALRDGEDRRVFSTLAPNSMGPLGPGDEVMILHAPQNPGRAVVAELYVEE